MNLNDLINCFYTLQVYACMKTNSTHMEYYKVMGMNKLQLISNMGESHKCKVEWKKTDTKRHMLYDALYISTNQGELINVI